MRLALALLVTVSTTLFASGRTLADAETRSLRSTKMIVTDATAEEERGLDFTKTELQGLKKLANNQFYKMATEPDHLKYILSSWKQGMRPLEDAADYMRNQGVSDSAIKHFIAAYFNHRL
ncbi:hypothetical protein F443_03062 [Phytophthora nicotianae P1569]|uniref:RxLR effector protein n=2 Tax=Phytophthora nicotianae TaxID=4792 RepID=V9FSK8_PHYNI|nr:hypothetical protein F443_03062 [Phytophthora nicotianae P1569]KUF98598.1 BAH and coiled-coil domain-containing protein 1 [Phytophthora nicotianae]